ncbi:hypothetical protein C8F01DRAFT_1253491 [Mycena amicta]|nr:hypothetical protein C8F01DRAFT_1253491 [Mycena amicta]
MAATLPASLQRQLQVASLISSGSASVYIWDLLNNLRAEYGMLTQSRFGLASVAYLASRIGALVYSLGILIFSSGHLSAVAFVLFFLSNIPAYPLHDCIAFLSAFQSFYPVASAGSAFLFFVRLRAVYDGHRPITIIFGFLWLCVVGTSIFVPATGTSLSINHQCLYTGGKSFTGTAGVVAMVYDTAVFFAISYQLVSNYGLDYGLGGATNTRGERLKMLFSGANLPVYSKALLTDGQVYYLITVLMNIVVTVLVYVPQDIQVYHGIAVSPGLVLTSIMATRVYRRTKLGLIGKSSGLPLTLPNVTTNRPRLSLTVDFSTLPPPSTLGRGGERSTQSGTSGTSGSASRAPRTPSKLTDSESFVLSSLPGHDSSQG